MITRNPRFLKEKLCLKNIVCTSGGFDPLHVGHVRCIKETVALARRLDAHCVVIVNGDGFLTRKKGQPFMSENERAEIIENIRGVDHVVIWDDGTQFVTGCIDILNPVIFTKGGDRDCAANVPEFHLCGLIGCEVVFGVGGGKIQSSSNLIATAKQHANSV